MPEDSKEIYRPEYSPAPEIPSWFAARLRAIGGETLSGQTKLRVVWGMDARGFPWPDNELKYVSPNDPLVGWACWILEQWVEPAFFGKPDEWEKRRWGWIDGKRVELMAPYPSRGEYIFIQQLATPAGESFLLSEQMLDYISWLVQNAHTRPHNAYTQQTLIGERLQAIRDWREEKRKESEERLAEAFDEHATRADDANRRATRAWSLPSVSEKARNLAAGFFKRGQSDEHSSH
jgi:hypothetical protein